MSRNDRATDQALKEKGDVVYTKVDDWAARLQAAAAALDAVVAEMREEKKDRDDTAEFPVLHPEA